MIFIYMAKNKMDESKKHEQKKGDLKRDRKGKIKNKK